MKELEIFFRKLILKIYLLFKKSNISHDPLQLNRSDKILLIRLNKIGDALVTTPIIHLIKSGIGCRIDILADKKNHFIFENDPNIDKTYVFEKTSDKIRLLKEKIASENYTTVFDLHDDVSTTVSLFIGSVAIKNKVGLDKENKRLFTHVVPYLDPTKFHVVERYLSFMKFLKIDYNTNEIRINYHLNEEALKAAENFIENNFSNDKPLIGINISAGSSSRFWGIKRYEQLISYFSTYDVNILILSAPSDVEAAQEISGDNYPIFTDPDFTNFAAMISKLDFLFTPDTSIVHLASAFNVPMFGIYVKYNTENVVWYPFNTKHELVATTDADFSNLDYSQTEIKLKTFFEQIYYGKRNTQL